MREPFLRATVLIVLIVLIAMFGSSRSAAAGTALQAPAQPAESCAARDPAGTIASCTAVIEKLRAAQKSRDVDAAEASLVAALYARAQAYYDNRQYDRALQDYDTLVAETAAHLPAQQASALFQRGVTRLKAGQFDEAIADSNAASQLQPTLAGALFTRGVARQKKGDVAGGRADVAAAKDMDFTIEARMADWSVAAGTRDELWEACTTSAMFANALVKAAACTSLVDTGQEASGNLGQIFDSRAGARMLMGRYDLAIQDYDQAITLQPDNAFTVGGRAFTYYRKGDRDLAIQDYDTAIRLDPANQYFFRGRGDVYYRARQYDRAIQDYDQAIKLDPEEADFFINRGKAYANTGQYDRAIQDYDKAIEIGGDDDAQIGRGSAFLRKGEYDRAIAVFDEILKIDEEHADARYGRGVAKLKKGDTAGGNADLAAAKASASSIADYMAQEWSVQVD